MTNTSVTLYFMENGFSKEDALEIASLFTYKTFQKNDFFVQEGKTNQHLAFLTQGYFQYFTNKNGVELTTFVMGPNNFLASIGSFMSQKPSLENIRALSDAALFVIHKKDVEYLKKNNESFRTYYIGLLEYLLVCIDDSKNKFITLTAEERYNTIMETEPEMLQTIPLQLMASMLGITPRHLSRIRAKK